MSRPSVLGCILLVAGIAVTAPPPVKADAIATYNINENVTGNELLSGKISFDESTGGLGPLSIILSDGSGTLTKWQSPGYNLSIFNYGSNGYVFLNTQHWYLYFDMTTQIDPFNGPAPNSISFNTTGSNLTCLGYQSCTNFATGGAGLTLASVTQTSTGSSTPVPSPPEWLMMLTGLGILLPLHRRHVKTQRKRVDGDKRLAI